MLAALTFALTIVGCASDGGWSVTEARTCAPKAPPRVCIVAEPDHGHVLEFADVELLPGECAAGADEGRGGLVHVDARDPRGRERGRWIRAPRGRTTLVEVDAEGKLDAARRRCDATPEL